jgi:hypothetical protein
MAFSQNIIALVYDFDGTLSPKPMQEYTILPELGEDATAFWGECRLEAKKHNADMMLTYMRLLIEKMRLNQKGLNREDLKNLACGIEYFAGVKTWFSRINDFVYQEFNGKIKVEHYIISAGLKEILNGVDIKDEFKEIFASEYFFDYTNTAQFPTIVVNDTAKTQYLFRINKGIFDINTSINSHMPAQERRVPFSNMIYVGDGLTDVPCMAITKSNGGYSLAVHKEYDREAKNTCKELFSAGRIDYFTTANYTQNSPLERKIKLIITKIAADILLNKAKFDFAKNL